MTKPQQPLFLQIGRKRYQVADLAQASAMFEKARDQAMAQGLGPNDVPQTFVVNEAGRKIARVSWNGRIWPAAAWHSDQKPLYDNRTSGEAQMPSTNGYRQMATTDGHFVVRAIVAFAHRRARDEFAGHVRAVGAKANPFTYAELFRRELTNAWGWAHAIRDAGQGRAPAFAAPMFTAAA